MSVQKIIDGYRELAVEAVETLQTRVLDLRRDEDLRAARLLSERVVREMAEYERALKMARDLDIPSIEFQNRMAALKLDPIYNVPVQGGGGAECRE